MRCSYQAKAKSDIAAVTAHVHKLMLEANRAPDSVKSEEIKIFCKNAGRLSVTRTRSVLEEHENPKSGYLGMTDPPTFYCFIVFF